MMNANAKEKGESVDKIQKDLQGKINKLDFGIEITMSQTKDISVVL